MLQNTQVYRCSLRAPPPAYISSELSPDLRLHPDRLCQQPGVHVGKVELETTPSITSISHLFAQIRNGPRCPNSLNRPPVYETMNVVRAVLKSTGFGVERPPICSSKQVQALPWAAHRDSSEETIHGEGRVSFSKSGVQETGVHETDGLMEFWAFSAGYRLSSERQREMCCNQSRKLVRALNS